MFGQPTITNKYKYVLSDNGAPWPNDIHLYALIIVGWPENADW